MADASPLPCPPDLAGLLRDGPVSLFLDFDGTLVPIAAAPGAIAVPAGIGSSLADLAERLGGRLAIVSGRAIADLERHCGPLANACAGSHGGEVRLAPGDPIRSIGAVPAAVLHEVAAFAGNAGLIHEVKPLGATLHWRGRPEWEERAQQFLGDLADRFALTLKHGKCVAEIAVPGADKGAAVRTIMAAEPFTGTTPVFIGDDVTDEDGFAACTAMGGFGVAVGERPSRGARYHLADPAAVFAWIGT